MMREAKQAHNTFDASSDAPASHGLVLQRKCACGNQTMGGECQGCSKGKGLLQRLGDGKPDSDEVPAIVHDVLRSPGQPLDASSRAFFEPRFGHDFSHVRVHADARAAESARAVNALAYTVGRDVVFAAGAYQPKSEAGSRLMAHELAHTLQQSGVSYGRHTPLRLSPADGAGEREADRAATEVGAHRSVIGAALSEPRVQRSPQPPAKSAAPPCPTVKPNSTGEDFKAAACARPVPPGTPPGCEFTPDQANALKVAQGQAAARVQRALERLKVAEGKAFATELAARLFISEAPKIEDVVKTLSKVEPLLSGKSVKYEGRTCADETCKKISVVAYVKAAGQLPIFICPVAFHEPDELYRKVLHEALHWAGIIADERLGELYCETFDCQTACGTGEMADAWMHYVSCLGEPPAQRRSFIPGLIKSAEEID